MRRSVFVLLLLATPAQAAERLKIGIALGGGSARGIAHVGVLEWLEEHQVPVDFIAGTSMGGLVGGAYATGMSGNEVRELLGGIDWQILFLGEAPYRLKSFRRKEDRREFPVKLEIGLRGGVKVPSGLDPAHQIGLVLSRIALPYSRLSDFRDLPTPFYAVATDMNAADVVVLGDGSLSHALLATMAIPAVFPAVSRDGKVLSDGGVLNNVPADVVRAMGADIVIAIDVSAIREAGNLDSAFTAASQAIDVMMASATRPIRDSADIVIRPDLEAFGSFDWRRSDAIADVGRAAVEEHAEALEVYRLDDGAWAEHLEARRSRTQPRALEPAFVEVEGAGQFTEDIEERLSVFTHAPLDFAAWHQDLTAITGNGRLESLRYDEIERDGVVGLRVIAKEKTYGPPFMRFNVGLNNANQDVEFSFGTRLTALDVGKTGAELRVQAEFGVRLGAGVEYYYPFIGRKVFVAPSASYLREFKNEFASDDLVASRRDRRAGAGVDLGVTNSRNTELRFGYRIADVESTIRVGDPELPQPEGKEELLRLRFVYDGHDAPIIPRRGVRTEARIEWFQQAPDAERAFGRARLDVSGFMPRGENDSIFILGRAGASFGGTPPSFYDFTLGGPLRLGAFELDEFRGENVLYGGLGYLREVARLPEIIGGPIYLTGLVETGSVFTDLDAARYRFSVGGGILMDTAFGPLFAIVSGGSDTSFKFYFTLGRFVSPSQ